MKANGTVEPPRPKASSIWDTFNIKQWLAEKRGPEQTKVILSRSPLIRIEQIIIHLIPIGITAAVLTLALTETYWNDPFDPINNTKLQGLQFAAKVYETFIVLSLASTVLDVLRRGLLGRHGVPLGALVTSYSFDRISSLFSPAFWTALWSSSWLLVFILTIAVLLAAASGPSAAIALIPRLEWWSVPQIELFRGDSSSFGWESRYTINSPASQLWPSTVDSSHLPGKECLLPPGQQLPTCPGAGYPLLLGLATPSLSSGGGQPSPLSPLNLTVPESVAATTMFIRQLTSEQECVFDEDDAPTPYAVVSSTPSFTVAASVWNFLEINNWSLYNKWDRPLIEIESFNGLPPVKPFVQVNCNWTSHATSPTVEFPSYGFVTPGMSPAKRNEIRRYCSTTKGVPNHYSGQKWAVDQSTVINRNILNQHIKDKTIHFRWVDLAPKYPIHPSLAALIYIPDCDAPSSLLTLTCSLDARWIPTKAWIEPQTSIQILGLAGGKHEFLDAMPSKPSSPSSSSTPPQRAMATITHSPCKPYGPPSALSSPTASLASV
ncbi:hypothetical protein B0T16DRAFT_423571 [Cercophora newfieldiana]|uniref:Uncharacterized protein n=1 Tax=Cercophora newfieldiana TaxID=92897 RepID=A0AA39XU31_9PEZI|nr:hypothetical protein B0T16DRAFT_423571 [Cercophora newfieldiana]